MSNQVTYSKKSVVRAMLIAPLAGLLGALPFLFNLNLSAGQFALAGLAILILSYVLTALVGSPGYLLLKALGRTEAIYLLAYALAVVAIVALAFGDVYALVSFAPAALLITGLFCYLREPIQAG